MVILSDTLIRFSKVHCATGLGKQNGETVLVHDTGQHATQFLDAMHSSNALGARMTVPVPLHPLDSEANSHVAEGLRGEVAQGAVPTCARSQQNKERKSIGNLSIFFENVVSYSLHLGALKSQKDQL